ncbi:MAG: histidine--tRNA ligase [bacterium]
MLKPSRPKGTQDFTPPRSGEKFGVETIFRELAQLYGYQEIITPTFEYTEVFIKSSGVASDVVTKEMYTFPDRAKRSLTLKPEGTPGVVRAVLENQLRLPCRLFYITPCFRYSRPQKGRFREFYQLGIEALGEASPLVDTEVVLFGMRFFERLNIGDCSVKVNSIGCRRCRPVFREKLLKFLQKENGKLCPDCQSRQELSPLRVFDCKNERCQNVLIRAPVPREHLCSECATHFDRFVAGLRRSSIRFEIDDRLVRGLDYYNRTAFEFISQSLGAQNSLGGGGRYDYLFEEFGGPETAAIGLAIGLERTLLAMPVKGSEQGRRRLVFVIWTGEKELDAAQELVERLRLEKIPAQIAYDNPKLRRQFHLADVASAWFAVVVGAEELCRGVYAVKNLLTGEQSEVPASELLSRLKQELSL